MRRPVRKRRVKLLRYQTIIKIKKNTPLAKAKMINAIIRGLFNNRAGRVLNRSKNPYTLVFAGDEKYWGCIDLGTLALEDVPGLLGYIDKCWWIDRENPAESSDVLKTFAMPMR